MYSRYYFPRSARFANYKHTYLVNPNSLYEQKLLFRYRSRSCTRIASQTTLYLHTSKLKSNLNQYTQRLYSHFCGLPPTYASIMIIHLALMKQTQITRNPSTCTHYVHTLTLITRILIQRCANYIKITRPAPHDPSVKAGPRAAASWSRIYR